MKYDYDIIRQDSNLIILDISEIENLEKILDYIKQKTSMNNCEYSPIKIVFGAHYVREVYAYLETIGYSAYFIKGTSVWLSKGKENSLSSVDFITQIIEENCKIKELEMGLHERTFELAYMKSMIHQIENEFFNIQAQYFDSVKLQRNMTLPPIWHKMAKSKVGVFLRKVFSLYCRVKRIVRTRWRTGNGR